MTDVLIKRGNLDTQTWEEHHEKRYRKQTAIYQPGNTYGYQKPGQKTGTDPSTEP